MHIKQSSRYPIASRLLRPIPAAAVFFMILLTAAPVFAASGIGYVKPAAKDKCPVCGMFVAKYPDWIAEAVFRDGSYQVFDGPKDLFKFLNGMQTFAPGKKRSDIQAAYVLDYYAVKPIDGFAAWYVLGSDVYGPMGRELIPFEKEAEALEFMKDHQGKRMVRHKDVTPEVLKGLD